MTPISERLRVDSKGTDAFVAIVPLHGLRHEAANTIDALVAALEELLKIRSGRTVKAAKAAIALARGEDEA